MRGDEGLGARVARLEEDSKANADHRRARDREIKQIRDMVTSIDTKVDRLVAAEDRRSGAISMGKWVVGTGFFGASGTAIIAVLAWLRSHS